MDAVATQRQGRLEGAGQSLNTAGLTRSEIVGRRFRLRVLAGEPEARVVFVCAECGMGKTWLAQDALAYLKKQGYCTRYESFEGIESERACRKLMALAREVKTMTSEPGGSKAVVVDDLPPIEECDLARVKRALGRMVSANTFVLVCTRPEGEALAEEMASSQRLLSADLIEMYHVELETHGFESVTSTRDIACLVFDGTTQSSSVHSKRKAWCKAVGSLANGLLRETLPLEDQQLRLAMMLMGTGGFDELQPVVARLDAEMLDWLSRDTPFFGIDRVQGTFECAGLSELWVFEECVGQLKDACGRMPETVENAAYALAARGDYARLAEICDFCSDRVVAEICCMWGVELVCDGRIALVERALQLHRDLGLPRTPEQALADQALAWVGDTSVVPSCQAALGTAGEDTFDLAKKRRIVELLRMCRNLDRCAPSGKVAIRGDDDETARALVRHIKARRFILAGRATEAYALLVNDPLRLMPHTLVSAWLCDDFEIAQALIGETPREEELRAHEQARSTMAQTGIERLVRYQSMIGPLMTVLVGRGKEFEGAEEVVARASRVGDDGIQAILLLALAVLDNRKKAFARAHVRAVQAADLLTGTNGRHLLLIARLVDALAAMGLGDNSGLASLARRTTPSVVRDLAAFMACQETEVADSIELSVLSRTNGSQDVVWLLNVLCNDFEGASAAFREVIPKPWLAMSRRAVKKVQAMVNHGTREDDEEAAAREVMLAETSVQAAHKPLGEPERPVCINVLGEFSMRVNGELIPSTSFSQRKARSFLTFLAMRRGHIMRRFELVECVWPEADFDVGRQKIYEAASTVRRVITRKNDGKRIDPFVGSKSDGVVGLDTSIVACDVDQFERLSHAALAEDDDGRVVDLAIQATALYRGDLCETPFDATGAAEQRRSELRNLFVDVSVAGALAAMRDDLLPLAVRMAWAAHEASSMREDVVLVLVEALKMSGRVMDARNVYLSYARTLLEQTGEPPSASLRATIAKIIPSMGSGKARKGGGPKKKRTLAYTG